MKMETQDLKKDIRGLEENLLECDDVEMFEWLKEIMTAASNMGIKRPGCSALCLGLCYIRGLIVKKRKKLAGGSKGAIRLGKMVNLVSHPVQPIVKALYLARLKTTIPMYWNVDTEELWEGEEKLG